MIQTVVSIKVKNTNNNSITAIAKTTITMTIIETTIIMIRVNIRYRIKIRLIMRSSNKNSKKIVTWLPGFFHQYASQYRKLTAQWQKAPSLTPTVGGHRITSTRRGRLLEDPKAFDAFAEVHENEKRPGFSKGSGFAYKNRKRNKIGGDVFCCVFFQC